MKSKKWLFNNFCPFRKLFLLSLSVLLVSCGDIYREVGSNKKKKKKNSVNINDSVILDAKSQTFYSRLSKPNTSGLRVNCAIPESKTDRRFYVILEGRIRSNYAHSNSGIVIQGVNSKKEQLCWRYIPLSYFYKELNTWCHFKDSVYIKSDYQWKNYQKFTAFANLGTSDSEVFDIDTLSIKIKEINP